MKKIIAALLIALFVVGCKTQTQNYYDPPATVVSSPDFNQEQYVWESFNFSTNRVQNVK